MIAQLSGPKSCLVYFCLALAAVTIGCADPPPESGYVRGKDYQPAHTEDGGSR